MGKNGRPPRLAGSRQGVGGRPERDLKVGRVQAARSLLPKSISAGMRRARDAGSGMLWVVRKDWAAAWNCASSASETVREEEPRDFPKFWERAMKSLKSTRESVPKLAWFHSPVLPKFWERMMKS